MKIITKAQHFLALAVVAAAAGLAVNAAEAQERPGRDRRGGDFDPAEFRQRAMERMREQFEVKDDSEWKVIETRIGKVMEAQRDSRMGGGFNRGGFAGRRGGDGQDGGRRGGPFGGETSPEADSLQKAVEAKASSEELKSKLAKYREARKAKEAALEKAQDDLRKVLTARQEATAVLMGLLK